MDKEYYMNVTCEDFEAFKHDLRMKDKKGAYHLVHMQKFAYTVTRELYETGKTSTGRELTPEEMGYTELILQQIIKNFDILKEEYDFKGDK